LDDLKEHGYMRDRHWWLKLKEYILHHEPTREELAAAFGMTSIMSASNLMNEARSYPDDLELVDVRAYVVKKKGGPLLTLSHPDFVSSSAFKTISEQIAYNLVHVCDILRNYACDIAGMAAITNALSPLDESGETKESIKDFKSLCASCGTKNIPYTDEEVSDWMAECIEDWLGDGGEAGTLLAWLTQALETEELKGKV
jgi:hypothetical protein